MSASDWLWIAVGYVLCAIAGFIAGALATVKVFQTMHNNSLPRKPKSKGPSWLSQHSYRSLARWLTGCSLIRKLRQKPKSK